MRAETAALQRGICAAQDALAVNEPAKSMPAIELGAKDEGLAGPRGGSSTPATSATRRATS